MGEAFGDRTPHVVHDGPDALLVLPPAGLLKPADVAGWQQRLDLAGGPVTIDVA
jgi:hypothetical protein